MAGVNAITDWWRDVTPERKRTIIIVVTFVLIMGAASIFKKQPKATLSPRTDPKLDMSVVMPTRKEEGVQELRARVDTLSAQLAQANGQALATKAELAQIKETGKELENSQISGLSREIDALKEDVKMYKSDILSGGTVGGKNLPIPQLPELIVDGKQSSVGNPGMQAVPSRPKIVVSGGSNASQASSQTPAVTPAATQTPGDKSGTKIVSTATSVVSPGAKQPVADMSSAQGLANGNAEVSEKFMQYLPAGSIFSGVLLNGIDAPTSSIAQKNPVPALMRIKSLAFLPNRVTQDIRECFIILSGYGSLSSERAKLRSEVITCIRNDGGVIETTLDGFAVGDDGKEGIPGTLVTKQGALIARSLLTGFISGFASAMKPTSIPTLNTSPGNTQQWQMPDMGSAAASGALTGLGSAANDVSKFFLDTAKEMHPIVEIPSGTEVTVILVRGSSLALNAPLKGSYSVSR